MLGYSKSEFITDAFLIGVVILTTYCFRFTFFFQEAILQYFFRAIIYLIDFAVFMAVCVSVSAKGAVVIFYVLRVIQLVYAQNFELDQSILKAIVAYILFKAGCLVVYNKVGPIVVESDLRRITEQMRCAEEKRRQYCLAILTVIIVLFTTIATFEKYSPVSGIFVGIALLLGVLEVKSLASAEEQVAKIISNTLHYNLYVLIVIAFIIGQVYHKDWLYHVQLIMQLLALMIGLIRGIIGSQSFRFHSEDKEVFAMLYPFAYEQVAKKYNSADRQNRVPKALDKISRKMANIVYFLSVAMAAVGGNYYWLPICFFLMRAYQIQSIQDQPTAWLQTLTKFQLKINITLPFLLFVWANNRSQTCQRAIIFDIVKGCQAYLQWQHGLSLILGTIVIVSQLITDKSARIKSHKFIALVCPLLIVLCLISLQCQTIQSVMLLIYCLALCFSMIRDDKLNIQKGSKKE